jgi:hypothetical protein
MGIPPVPVSKRSAATISQISHLPLPELVNFVDFGIMMAI